MSATHRIESVFLQDPDLSLLALIICTRPQDAVVVMDTSATEERLLSVDIKPVPSHVTLRIQ